MIRKLVLVGLFVFMIGIALSGVEACRRHRHRSACVVCEPSVCVSIDSGIVEPWLEPKRGPSPKKMPYTDDQKIFETTIFLSDYDQARQLAVARNKPIAVVFGAGDNGWSKLIR